MNSRHSAARKAFTLMELLVTIAVLATLMALLLPALSKVKKSAADTKCMANVRQIVSGAILYANDNDGRLPPFGNSTNYDFGRSWVVLISQYLGLPPEQIISVNYGRCPLAEPEAFGTYGVNYGWLGNTPFGYENEFNSRKVSDFPSSTMLCADSGPNGYIYSPLVYPLNASNSEDYLAGKAPDAAYNYMNFRHGGRAICGKIDGSVIRISVKDWVENTGNIWGERL